MNKLSHSKVSRYMMCPKSYKYHYIDKIRPIVQSGALIFGSAMDKALNELLLPISGEKPEDIFLDEFSKDGLMTDLNVVYANSDFDEDLLTGDDYREAFKLLSSFGVEDLSISLVLKEYRSLKSQKMTSGFDSLNDKQKTFYNTLNWLCLMRKGLIILRDYREHILPMLKKVHKVQIEINYKLDDDTVINGFIDFIAETKDDKIVLFDNKTSGSAYADDAVLNSPQLALYKEAIKELIPNLNIEYAGFIVMRKAIAKNLVKTCKSCGHIGKGRHSNCDNVINGKRCGNPWVETISPEAQFQILIDKIPQSYKNIVIDNFKEVNEGISKNVFPRNFDKCSNWYGGDCPHKEFCMNNNMKGLKKDEALDAANSN